MRRKDVLTLLCSVVLVMLLSFYGCGDDSTGNDTGTGEANWMPLTDGNSWTYKYVDNTIPGGSSITLIFEILNDTTLEDNIVYKKVKATSIEIEGDTITTVGTQYWAKTGGFFRIGEIDEIAGSVSWLDMLKIPAKQGDTWMPDPDDSTSTGTTLGFEDVTCDSLSKTFKGCAKVKLYLSSENLGEHDTTNYFYADGVGIVKILDVEDNIALNLISYTIK